MATGAYEIMIRGVRYTSANGTLMLQSSRRFRGTHAIEGRGPFDAVSLTWQAQDAARTPLVTTFYTYSSLSSVVFEQVRGWPFAGCTSRPSLLT